MSVNKSIILIIFLCGVVTWIPRVAPFVLSKKVNFPPLLNRYLSYLPMCILTALFVQGLLVFQKGQFPSFNFENIIASIPTLGVAVFTKDLMWTVIVGIISMAVLRFIM